MDEHADIRAWFTDQTGTCLLAASNNVTTEQPGPFQARSSESVLPNVGASALPDFGKIDLKLFELCAYVNQSTELQEARIVATESYVERARTVVTHRFLVLELRRHNLRDAWLRLDRRRGEDTSILKFLTLSGVTEANDEAVFSVRKGDVIKNCRLENRQMFDTPPTLRELRILLQVLGDELVKYRVWPENCWAFCSLIQQHLESAHGGRFEFGELKHAGIAQNIRIRVFRRLAATRSDVHSANGGESRPNALQHPHRIERPLVHGSLHQSRRLEMNLEPPRRLGVVAAEHHRASASVTHNDLPSTSLLYSEPLAQLAVPLEHQRASAFVTRDDPSSSSLPSVSQQEDAGISKSDTLDGRPQHPPLDTTSQLPKISDLIPNTGPVAGGIKIAVLGSHFARSNQCFFGSEAAGTRWQGDHALVCILPPGKKPGPVPVTIYGVPITIFGGPTAGGIDNAELPLFTYQEDPRTELVTILSLIMQALRESGQRSVATLNQPLQNLSPWLSTLSARQGGQTDVVEPSTIEVERIIIKLINLLDCEFSPGSALVKEMVSFTCGSKRTLLHLSAMLGSHELLQKIMDHGANLNQRDMCGCTALHYAALHGHIAGVNILVSGGANVEITDQWGRLARELAADSGHHDIADRLKACKSKTFANVKVSDIEDSLSREQVTETQKSPKQRLHPKTWVGSSSPRTNYRLLAFAEENGWTISWVDEADTCRETWTAKLNLEGEQVWAAQGHSMLHAREQAATEYLKSIGMI